MKFCTLCFASEADGSFHCIVVGDGCTNCSANGTVVELPEWAIANIRRNASWVGRRFYPCDEDREAQQERADLLSLVENFPGRTATLHTVDGRDAWEVKQQLSDRRVVSTYMPGYQSGAHAMRRAIGLRYVPQWRLDEAEKEQK